MEEANLSKQITALKNDMSARDVILAQLRRKQGMVADLTKAMKDVEVKEEEEERRRKKKKEEERRRRRREWEQKKKKKKKSQKKME